MPETVREINDALRKRKLSAQVTAYYRHTGNFVIEHTGGAFTSAVASICDTIERSCAVLQIADLELLYGQVLSLPSPSKEKGVRWTPGLVLLAEGAALLGERLKTTDKVAFDVLSKQAVAAWKRDAILPSGKLDPERRMGGWGAVASEVSRQINGDSKWTARSLSTVKGVLEKANQV